MNASCCSSGYATASRSTPRSGGSHPATHPRQLVAAARAGRILQVTDIPRTKSGKIVELAVRDVVHGREIRNREALANPEALEQFRNRPELSS